MQININNLDTENITIDTYGMFTGESIDEMMRENMREDGREDYDTVDIDYNMPEIVEGLARASIDIILQAIKYTDYAKIITGITYVSSHSPKFYNYTTDSYIAKYTVNEKELDIYTQANYEDIEEIVRGYDDCDATGNEYTALFNYATVCHILNNCITDDDYKMSMWESESEVYYENMTIDETPAIA